MGITNSNKEINVSQVNCDGTFKVTLALAASPKIRQISSSFWTVLEV